MENEYDKFSDIAWRLFAATGGVNYYLLNKKTMDDKSEKEKRR